MSNLNYEEENSSSSTDEYSDEYEETDQSSHQEGDTGDIYDFSATQPTVRTFAFSLPIDEGREIPHFPVTPYMRNIVIAK